MNKTIKVLIIEDSEEDVELILRELRRGGYEPTYAQARTPSDLKDVLSREKWNVIIAGYSIPQINNMKVLLQEREMALPCIIVSDITGEDKVVKAIKAGAANYITKKNISRLIPAVEDVLISNADQKFNNDVDIEELNKYKILINNMSDMAYICDTEGKILFVNRIFEKLSGHKPEEFTGKPFAPLFDDENLKKAMNLYTRTLNGESLQREFFFKDTGILCEYKNIPLRNEKGNIIGVIGTARDITGRKQMEEKLRKSEEQFRSIFENAMDGIGTCNLEGKLITINNTFLEITGYSKEELLKMRYQDLTPPEYHDMEAEKIRRLLKTGIPQEYEKEYIRKDGKKVPLLLKVSAIYNAEGKPKLLLAILKDMTRIKRAEEELKVLNESLELQINERTRELEKTNKKLLIEIDERTRAQEVILKQMSLARLGADIGIIFTEDDTLQRMLYRCAEAIVKHVNAAFARIWTLNKEENVMELQASAGMYTHIDGFHSRIPLGSLKIGLIAQERKAHLTNDLINDPRISDKDWAKREGIVAFAGYPLTVEDRLVGVMAMFAKKQLSKYALEVMESVAYEIALGVERKQAERILFKSEEKYSRLIENLNENYFFYSHNAEGIFTYVSPSITNTLGYTPEEFLTHYSEYMTDNPNNKEVIRHTNLSASGIKQPPYEVELYHKDGSVKIIKVQEVPVFDKNHNVIAVEGIAEDITQQKLAEKKLMTYQTQLKHLSTALSLAEERERRYIAENLHDRIGQSLIVLKMKLEVLQGLNPSTNHNPILNESRDILKKTIQEIRSMTFELSPPILYELGLVPAVEWLIEQFQKQHDIKVRFESNSKVKLMSDDMSTLLFKSVRELLFNIVKHANAHNVMVSINRKNNNIEINIKDDGVGFNPHDISISMTNNGGFGLFSIRERLEHIGGCMLIKSKPGYGTHLIMVAPMKSEKRKL